MSEQAYTESEHRGRDASPASSRSRSPRRRSRSPARPSADIDESVNPGNNLFVNSLAAKTEQSDLEDLFGKYGKVEKVQIMLDPHTRESRGFAFVTMVRAEDAEAAMSVLNSFELHGRAMSVKLAKRGRARTPTPGEYRGPPKRERALGNLPPFYGDRRPMDRFDPRFDPRGHDPRGEFRGAPMRDYGRPAPYDRWMAGARPRYDDRPPRDYRPAPYGMERGYEERPMYDRGYERRPPSRYDERYARY
ncbi:hypothetical protein BGZ59_011382 [Podila verticillata]|nr:hypothetical protein BGZ59_011382 [Podila verticillata]KFH71731.1 hypothetical protein MVEG_02026 [Podila verticillata NRRL 6337]